MRAVLYLRRSTDEHQAASLEVQESEARRFCEARGWTVIDTYREDAVSRAEFQRRPELARMLAAASTPKRAFDIIVLRDETRLGGDLWRTGMILQDLYDHGVKCFYYFTGEEVRLDDPTMKFMQAAKLFASELERVKISTRTRENLAVRARSGAVVGGRVYGYDNVRSTGRVDYVVNETEAEVVREIFERYAAGAGLRAIVKVLNDRGTPAPRAGRGGTGSWSSSSIGLIVHRERYRGVLEWGRVGAEYRHGTRKTIERPDSQVVRVERPDLRIVDDELWDRAQAAAKPTHGGTRKGAQPHYLLSGISRCGACGGPISVINGKHGRDIVKVYTCAWHRDRGDAVCTVTTRRRVELVDDLVVTAVRDQVLSGPVVEEILRVARGLVEGNTDVVAQELEQIAAEQLRLRAEIGRLTSALASGARSDAIVAEIVERERRIGELGERHAALRLSRPGALSWREVEHEARERLQELRGMFSRGPNEGREALKRLLRGPLRFTRPPERTEPGWVILGEIHPAGFMSVGDPNGLRTDLMPSTPIRIAA